MNVAISGSSGLIGSALVSSLQRRGHVVRRLVRRAPRDTNEVSWNPARGEIAAGALDGVDAVVNLAGENIAQRWTAAARRAIRDSRMQATSTLASAIARAGTKPGVFVSSSAVGIYGNRGDELLDESSSLGSDFLATICAEWEASAAPAADAGVRVVYPRSGLVLSARGGALEKLLLPFRMGVGGRIGSGRQWMSWITLADEVRALEFLITSDLSGPVNVVAPSPVRNEEFTRTLGKALHRPTFFPVPAAALELAMGDMARDTILASQRVAPRKLLSAGFQFENPELASALRVILASEG